MGIDKLGLQNEFDGRDCWINELENVDPDIWWSEFNSLYDSESVEFVKSRLINGGFAVDAFNRSVMVYLTNRDVTTLEVENYLSSVSSAFEYKYAVRRSILLKYSGVLVSW